MRKVDRRKFIQSLAMATAGVGLIPLLSSAICKGNSTNTSMNVNRDKHKGFEPAYLALHRSGELKIRASELYAMMQSCTLCPRDCRVNRIKGEEGVCNATAKLQISSYQPHFGEERPLVGKNGSGTVFFTHCSLLCVFCINWEISHGGQGSEYSTQALANMMLNLQKMGCHNINVVTPTHYSPHILEALDIAAAKGLRLPVAYNTCGWEKLEILQILDGVVDIYLADYKYTQSRMGGRYSAGAFSYPKITQDALKEMNKQVGVAIPNDNGILERGLIIRHLVMPNHVDNSVNAIRWIAENLPKDTYVNIMSQYTPIHKAKDYPELSRRITRAEYNTVVDAARGAGLVNIDVQG